MEKNSLVERAEKIIKDNRYLTMGTASSGSPWVAPINYVIGPGPYLHFYSALEARHSKDVEANSHVACAVFNSTAVSSDVDGMQFEGLCTVVSDSELAHVSEHYFEVNFADPDTRAWWYRPASEFTGNGPWRFYRLEFTAVFLIDFDSVANFKIDRRVSVDLDALQHSLVAG